MDKPPVFFWQNMPAHHQAGALDAFAGAWGAPVTGVWNDDVSAGRQDEGWRPSARRHLRDIFLPPQRWERVVDSLVGDHPEAIHVFSGIGAYAPTTRAARRLLRQPAPKAGLIVETLLKGRFRRFPSFLKGLCHYYPVRGKIGAVMAIGSQAEACYASLGFDPARIYPYLYQCDAPAPTSSAPASGPLRLIYVGRLVSEKGLGVVLQALAKARRTDWSLDVFGDGPAKGRFVRQALSLGISSRVAFRGVIPSATVVETMAAHDLCVAPSEYDGWGMAVSEAIRAGIPALVSREAGASDLIATSRAGEVLAARDVRRWTEALSRRIDDRDLIAGEKNHARALAPRLTPSVVGAYLRAALEHAFLGAEPRPAPPWRDA